MPQQLREKVTFDPNVPIAVTLEFDHGKEVPSARGGSQFQYFLDRDRIMYVEPEVAERITASGARAGDTLEICKRSRRIGQQTRTEWEVVHLLDSQEPTDYAQAEPARHTTTQQRAATQPPPAPAPRSQPRPAPAAVPAPPQITTTSVAVIAAFKAAIDAAADAEDYARSRGRTLSLDSDAIRALAITIYIQEAKR
jgi:hypothetical protein